MALVFALAIASPSNAVEPRDAAAAEVLFRRAKELLAAGQVAQACSVFAESLRLDPATGTLLNLAACEEQQGKVATAWQHFVDARAALPPGDFRIAFAEKRIAALEPRVPQLTLSLAGDVRDARVFRDDIELGGPSLGVALPTDPGRHLLVVRAPGRSDSKVEVVLEDAERKSITLESGPPIAATANAAAAPPDTTASTGSTRKTVGYVVGGAGALGLAVGIVSGFITLDAASRYEKNCTAEGACNPDGLDAARTGKTFEVVTPIALGAGAAALLVGAYLVLSTPAKTATITPVVSSTGASVVFGKAFW